MCLAVYIASDANLPLIGWDEKTPAFNVAPVRDDERLVTKQFTKRNVAYAGSYQGCSCGFVIDPDDSPWEEDELCERSVRQLGDYIEALLPSGTVELYTCWGGDEWTEPESRINVTIDHFRGPKFSFEEKQFITVVGN